MMLKRPLIVPLSLLVLLGLSENTQVIVPIGLKSAVQAMNKRDVVEMDWWEEINFGNGIRLVCLPAQHWSKRISHGLNETLWASFMLITPAVTIYLGGDSGYFIGYREIGKRFPGIDYAKAEHCAVASSLFSFERDPHARPMSDPTQKAGMLRTVKYCWVLIEDSATGVIYHRGSYGSNDSLSPGSHDLSLPRVHGS
jgi:hypothetical protein